MVKVNWRGVFPAVTTQFKADQSLDLEATAKHIDGLIGAGVHGLVMIGTVGENTSLGREEKLEVLRTAVETSARRVPVITGVAEYTTALGAEFAREAEKAGVDGLMVLPAMVYKSDPRETIDAFPHGGASLGAAGDGVQQPGFLRRRYHAGDVRRTRRRADAGGDQGIVGERAADHRPEQPGRRPVRAVRGRRRPGVRKRAAGRRADGFRGWSTLSRKRASSFGISRPPASTRKRSRSTAGTRRYCISTRMPKLVQYIKLVAQETGRGSEMVRAPRLPLVGAEREQILALTRKAIATRPTLRQPA